jgi:hypothetical protein
MGMEEGKRSSVCEWRRRRAVMCENGGRKGEWCVGEKEEKRGCVWKWGERRQVVCGNKEGKMDGEGERCVGSVWKSANEFGYVWRCVWVWGERREKKS